MESPLWGAARDWLSDAGVPFGWLIFALPKAAKGARPCFRYRGFPVRSTNCLTRFSRIWPHQSRQTNQDVLAPVVRQVKAHLPEHDALLRFLGAPWANSDQQGNGVVRSHSDDSPLPEDFLIGLQSCEVSSRGTVPLQKRRAFQRQRARIDPGERRTYPVTWHD
jgi:hypothetical protein